jgi:hypothetical protein
MERRAIVRLFRFSWFEIFRHRLSLKNGAIWGRYIWSDQTTRPNVFFFFYTYAECNPRKRRAVALFDQFLGWWWRVQALFNNRVIGYGCSTSNKLASVCGSSAELCGCLEGYHTATVLWNWQGQAVVGTGSNLTVPAFEGDEPREKDCGNGKLWKEDIDRSVIHVVVYSITS